MSLVDIFRTKAVHLSWDRLGPDAGVKSEPIEKRQAYFVLRLKEMYVALSRKLWRKYYPMLHSYVEHGASKENAIAGPGQLRELGEANMNRIVNLNYRLAGPTVFTGEEVSMLVGLYSVPGQDAARALIETVSAFAALGGVAASPALEIAGAVKAGVEKIVGLNDAELQLGIRDTFNAGRSFASGVYAGINAPAGSVDYTKLWLKGGRLHYGSNPISSRPYDDHDYMLIEVERRDTRDDWPALPGIAEFQGRFAAVMGGSGPVSEKRRELAELWPCFQQALATSSFLTDPDKENIADSVSQDLMKRLDAMERDNPFETRGWRELAPTVRAPDQFDFVDIGLYTDRSDRANLMRAQVALAGNPFGD